MFIFILFGNNVKKFNLLIDLSKFTKRLCPTRVVGGGLGPLVRPAGAAVGAVGLAARHHGARRARH